MGNYTATQYYYSGIIIYDSGTNVTVTATARAGCRFDHWTGDLSGSTSPATLIMDANKSVTAVFVQQFTLTTAVSPSGAGSVTPPDSTLYDAGSSATITPQANTGWRFDHWEGDLTGNSNPGTVTMDANKAVTAVFIQQYKLTVDVYSGQGTTTPSGETWYDPGTVVTATATPAENWCLHHWVGYSGGANPATITMDSDKLVRAVFVPLVTLTTTVSPPEAGTVNPTGTYTCMCPSETTVQAWANPGWRFDHWEGDVTGSTNPSVIIMDANKSVTAVFIPRFTLTTVASPAEAGSVTPAGTTTYDSGTSVTVTAVEESSSYVFAEWEGDLDGSTNPQTITMDANKAVTAKFELVTVGLTVEDNITECMEGRLVTYTATASDNFPIPITFTFKFQRADGTPWEATEWSSDRTEDYTAVADSVPDGDADHKFSTPIYVEADGGGKHAESDTMWIDVYELWIEYFRDEATAKDWKVVVGANIAYGAIASSDCTNWFWDMTDGLPDMWNPTGGNAKTGTGMVIPNSDLPGASGWSYFGDTYGTVYVYCEDGDGNDYELYSTAMNPACKAKVYFDPQLTVDGSVPASDDTPPCWFVYWRGGAVPDLHRFEYKHMAFYGYSELVPGWLWNSCVLQVGIPAAGTHYPGGLVINGIPFGGATGIDCCAEVVKHELQHVVLFEAIQGGETDADPATPDAPTPGDLIGDVREAALGCSTANQDTFNVAGAKGIPDYVEYGDGEYAVMVFARGAVGDLSKDWSKGGKQW